MIVYIGTSWLICLGVGVLLFWRKSDDWMVLLVATMLVAHVGGDPTALALSTPAWLVSSIWFVASVTLGLVFTLFPDGRFVPRWMRWLMIGWILLAICLFFNDAPFGVSHWPVLLQSAAGLAAYGGYGCIIATQIYRYRHVSDRVQRQKIKWVILAITLFLLAVIAVVLGLIPLLILFPSLGVSSTFLQLFSFTRLALMTGVFLLIPLSFAIAVLRHRLWDIDIILNRTLVYGILTFSVVGLYVLIVGTLGSLFQAQGNLLISLLATGLIAVLFQPLRSRLQRAVNRLMFGERDEPYAVLSRLGQRLEATLAPDAVLPMLTETVAQALKLPYAAIGLLQDGGLTIVASYFQSPQAGPENTPSAAAPLEYKDTPEIGKGQVGMH
jgi:hypothetical protein